MTMNYINKEIQSNAGFAQIGRADLAAGSTVSILGLVEDQSMFDSPEMSGDLAVDYTWPIYSVSIRVSRSIPELEGNLKAQNILYQALRFPVRQVIRLQGKEARLEAASPKQPRELIIGVEHYQVIFSFICYDPKTNEDIQLFFD